MSPHCKYLLVCVLLTCGALAQQPEGKNVGAHAIDDAFVQKAFGSTCSLLPGPTPMFADLNGDGVEDAVIVAHCKDPMLDQVDRNYKVIDPYNSFFGYGDPKVTSEFASEDPERRGLVLLVIHGSGPDAWRSSTPKAKFMMINLPFKQVMLKKLMVKKKAVVAIYAEEDGGDRMTSATFWAGKKYKYEPLGSSME